MARKDDGPKLVKLQYKADNTDDAATVYVEESKVDARLASAMFTKPSTRSSAS